MGEIRIKRDVSDAIVYGFHVDPSISDPSNAITYLEDAVGMTPASMGSTTFNAGSWGNAFFIPKPCMVRYDGTVDYYLDPSDYSKKADGTASDVADPNYGGNAMMEWPLIWYKYDTENLEEGEVNFYVSNEKVDDSYHCWCNYDADGNIIPHFYTAIYNGITAPTYSTTATYSVGDRVTYSSREYECNTVITAGEAWDSSKWTLISNTTRLRSLSGVLLTPSNGNANTTGTVEVNRATANNTTTKTEWYIDILADRELINMLLVLIGKSLNAQAVFGRGLDIGNQAAKEAYVTGTLDNKGLFWGVTGNGNNAVKVFGMENYWGCVWHRVAGMVSVHDNTTNSNTYKIKLTHSTMDGTTVDGFNSTGSGYIDTGVEVTTNVGLYIRKMKYFDKGYSPLLTTGGSATKYYSDYTYVNYVGTYYLLAGGCSGNGLVAGPFFFGLHSGFSFSHWSVAAVLSLKPRAKIPYNPDWDNRPAHRYTNGEWVDIPTHHYTNGRWQGELTNQSPLKFWADGEMLDWRVEGKTSQNLFDIGKNVNDYERAYQMISVDGSLISMKLEGSGMTFHYRTHNITTTGTVTIYCKGSKAKPQLFVRLRSMDDTKWLTNSDVTISGMAYNSVYNGWFSYAMDDTFIKTIIIPECLYWNMGVGFNSTAGTMGEIVTISNPMVISGTYTASTLPPYEPYGGVGDYDETTQRYKIPIRIEGENLFDGELEQGGITAGSETVNNARVRTVENTLLKEGTYTINCVGATGGVIAYAYNTDDLSYDQDASYIGWFRTLPFTFVVNDKKLYRFVFKKEDDSAIVPSEVTNVQIYEGTYTASTIPPYEVNLFTDRQLMDGDSIDYTTTETQIPIATGNNILTVDTAVQPSKVFVKFEG